MAIAKPSFNMPVLFWLQRCPLHGLFDGVHRRPRSVDPTTIPIPSSKRSRSMTILYLGKAQSCLSGIWVKPATPLTSIVFKLILAQGVAVITAVGIFTKQCHVCKRSDIRNKTSGIWCRGDEGRSDSCGRGCRRCGKNASPSSSPFFKRGRMEGLVYRMVSGSVR